MDVMAKKNTSFATGNRTPVSKSLQASYCAIPTHIIHDRKIEKCEDAYITGYSDGHTRYIKKVN
jgi:hypothetical protein